MRRRLRKVQTQIKKNESPFFKPAIQAKLKMGRSGDKHEVEADKMADKVVNKNNEGGLLQRKEGEDEVQAKPLAAEVTSFVQRMESTEEEPVQQKEQEEESVQKMEEEEAVQSKEDEEVQAKKCGDCEKEHTVQKMEQEEEPVQSKEEENAVQSKEDEEVQSKASNKKPTKHKGSFESKLRRGNGGQRLARTVRNEMEAGFGSSFSHIKIHNDSEAAKMSASIGAQAFTHGNDIYFNKGKFNPNSKDGKILLAHELTHTIQQEGAKEKKIQRQPSYGGATIKQDINAFDASTAPAGNVTGLGHTALYVNGHELKSYHKQNGNDALKELLFPLPKYTKLGGKCYITSKDIAVKMHSVIRIVGAPFSKEIPKNSINTVLGGVLVDPEKCKTGGDVTINIQGQESVEELRANTLKAEMQHAKSDLCLFETYIKKYQEDVNALPDEFDAGYLGLGSCKSRLEEQLNRRERTSLFVHDMAAATRFYDFAGLHTATIRKNINEGCSEITAKITLDRLGMERDCK